MLNVIASLEQQYGLPPGLLESVWEQESSRSTDMGLKGPDTKWGNAIGPFQMLPKFHGTFDTFEGQADAAARMLRKGFDETGTAHGAAMYYFGGPNRNLWGDKTRKYGDEVISRLDRVNPSVNEGYYPVEEVDDMGINWEDLAAALGNKETMLASTAPIEEMGDMVASNPMAAAMPENYNMDFDSASLEKPSEALPQSNKTRENSVVRNAAARVKGEYDYDSLFSNPWLQMGLGIMSQIGSGPTGAVVGRGAMLGLASVQAHETAKQKRALDYAKLITELRGDPTKMMTGYYKDWIMSGQQAGTGMDYATYAMTRAKVQGGIEGGTTKLIDLPANLIPYTKDGDVWDQHMIDGRDATVADVSKAGGTLKNKESAKKHEVEQALIPQLQTMHTMLFGDEEQGFPGLYTTHGDLFSRARQAGVNVFRYLANDPQIEVYKRQVDSMGLQVARLLGEVGNLNLSEQESAKRLFPGIFWQDRAGAEIKWNNIMGLISEANQYKIQGKGRLSRSETIELLKRYNLEEDIIGQARRFSEAYGNKTEQTNDDGWSIVEP